MGEYLRKILSGRIFADDWQPISRYAAATWAFFYAGFLIYAFTQHGNFLLIDSANLVVHEGGHLLFGWFGPSLGLWGGPYFNGSYRFCWPHTFLAKDKRQPSLFARSSFSKTGSTRRRTWLTPALWSCRWSRRAIPIILSMTGTLSFPA